VKPSISRPAMMDLGEMGVEGTRNPFVDRPEWVAAAFIPALSIARISDGFALTWTNEADAPISRCAKSVMVSA